MKRKRKYKTHIDVGQSGQPWSSICGRLSLKAGDGDVLRRFYWFEPEDGALPKGDYCKFCLKRVPLVLLAWSTL